MVKKVRIVFKVLRWFKFQNGQTTEIGVNYSWCHMAHAEPV